MKFSPNSQHHRVIVHSVCALIHFKSVLDFKIGPHIKYETHYVLILSRNTLLLVFLKWTYRCVHTLKLPWSHFKFSIKIKNGNEGVQIAHDDRQWNRIRTSHIEMKIHREIRTSWSFSSTTGCKYSFYMQRTKFCTSIFHIVLWN